MKTRIQNLFIALPVLLLLLPAVVQAQDAYSTNADGSIYTYSTNADGSANIVAYAGPPWVVTIPTNINGLTVTSIGTNAFAVTALTSVTIPGSVTSIGDHAFGGCTGLTGVTIPNSVTSIGDSAFVLCTSLIFVTIPNSVTNIGDSAFESCIRLSSATIGNSVTSIGYSVFNNCTHLIIVTIGNSVTNIGQYAFLGCLSMTSVTIPNSVTSIGNGAFADCNSLPSVTIPNSVTSIGNGAFAGCIGLTSVMIPDSVTSIGDAFVDCTRLTVITVAANNPAYSSLNGVLFDKSQTTLIQYPGGLVGSYTIPGSVTNIGQYAFAYCFSLTSVTIPGSVTNIGVYAFFDCTSLTSIYFKGNAPSPTNDSTVFSSDSATVYYLPGATGWGSTFGGVPAVLWNPQATAMSFTGGQFGFNLTGPAYAVIVVEACTNLSHPVWLPVSTNTLSGLGTSAFSDPIGYPMRYYRFRSP